MRRQLRVSLGQHSLAGAHPVNQDFHGARLPTGHQLISKGIVLALADGISSSSVSQLASQTAVRTFLEDYYLTSEVWTVRRAAQCVLSATNSWLHGQTMRSDARFDKDRGYACTFSALILKGRHLHMLHVGDARVFRLHPQALEQLSEDHRVRLSSSESYLARALGIGAHVEIDYRSWEAGVGEIYLLATDGAYDHLSAASIHETIGLHPQDLDAAAALLVAQVRAAGSTDDATLQLLRVEELPDEDAFHAQFRREELALPAALTPGVVFEGFSIVRALQVSARSHLHLAVDVASGQTVVLKTPSVELRQDQKYRDSFVFEEWVTRRISSPHVVKAWQGDRPRSHVFVALEYIEGQTLAQWMRDHPRPPLDAVRNIIEQLATGLDALHRRDMHHRDLRPENVMIDSQGTVKLIDLATVYVAGLAETSHEHSQTAAPGTLQYMAPECLLGRAAGERSDLFSLAAIGYQMLCGQLPYGLSAARVRTPHDLRGMRYVPVRHHRPDLPPWLDAVLAKALHVSPQKRQEAVTEFAHDLKLPGAPFNRTERPPLIERDPVFFWKCSSLILLLMVIALLALCVVGR